MVATARVSSLELVVILSPVSTIVVPTKRSVHLVFLGTHVHVPSCTPLPRFLNVHFWWLLLRLGIRQLLQFLLKRTKIHVVIHSGCLYYRVLMNHPFLNIRLILFRRLSFQLLFLPLSRLFCGNLGG